MAFKYFENMTLGNNNAFLVKVHKIEMFTEENVEKSTLAFLVNEYIPITRAVLGIKTENLNAKIVEKYGCV
jgi:hypothetical protein